jgi:hypothetical protein
MNFHTTLIEHYAAVRMRLRAPILDLDEIEEPKALLLDYHPESHVVVDLVPDQRGKKIMPIDRSAEIVAARRALAGFARRMQICSNQSIRQLQISVAEAFKADLDQMLSRSHKAGPTRIRQIAMALARRVCKQPRAEIGRRFDRNHSTCIHAEKKFAWLLDGATSQIGGA